MKSIELNMMHKNEPVHLSALLRNTGLQKKKNKKCLQNFVFVKKI